MRFLAPLLILLVAAPAQSALIYTSAARAIEAQAVANGGYHRDAAGYVPEYFVAVHTEYGRTHTRLPYDWDLGIISQRDENGFHLQGYFESESYAYGLVVNRLTFRVSEPTTLHVIGQAKFYANGDHSRVSGVIGFEPITGMTAVAPTLFEVDYGGNDLIRHDFDYEVKLMPGYYRFRADIYGRVEDWRGDDHAFGLYWLTVWDVNAGPPPPVPEPGTLALVGLGLTGLAQRRRHARSP